MLDQRLHFSFVMYGNSHLVGSTISRRTPFSRNPQPPSRYHGKFWQVPPIHARQGFDALEIIQTVRAGLWDSQTTC